VPGTGTTVVNTIFMKRVTIIGDESVHYRIAEELREFGVTGYTSAPVQGLGAKGARPRHGESGNVRIEVIASPELAKQILDHVAKNYFEKYAMIAFLDDVEVVRGEKFSVSPVVLPASGANKTR